LSLWWILDGAALNIPETKTNRTFANLATYERKNPRKLAERAEPMESGSLLIGATVALMLLLFFFVTVQMAAGALLVRAR